MHKNYCYFCLKCYSNRTNNQNTTLRDTNNYNYKYAAIPEIVIDT